MDGAGLLEDLLLRPTISSSAVSANPNNVISAVVTAETQDARSVRVELGTGGSFQERTPEFEVSGATHEIPVLGLLPETDYSLRVVATSASGDTAIGLPLAFRTGRLPESIARLEVSAQGTPEPGYTLLSPNITGAPHPPVIIDNAGRVVWYRETPTKVVDFQLQPNGHFTAAVEVGAPLPFFAAVYEEWDVLGNVVDTWTVHGHEFTDLHEIRLLEDGQEALLLGFVVETPDVSPFAEVSAPVVGNVLQRVTRAGGVAFEWNTFDHYPLEDADDHVWIRPEAGGYDHTHANAIELDRDGNYLLSTRHFSEITKIDSRSGEIIWRMGGGKGNEFTFLNDPRNGFSAMHSIRVLENGNFLLLDNGNGHTPRSSRAVEYAIDEEARTATLVWSFEPGIFSCCMGFAQRLAGGNTLVNLGQDYRVFEVSPAGDVVWEARLPGAGAGFFGIYRASRIPSLYAAR